ncbi:dihydroorotate dehydrogenase (quinone) [Campylobacterota bacterium]|nr:dihydroorotate dehydrogenase (quinone) [Campylobacterota bacterium]
MLSYETLRSLLFKLPPETAHTLAEFALRTAALTPFALGAVAARCVSQADLKQTIFGLKFPNPIGIGAGFDKNGTMIRPLAALGFGFIEVGTGTPKAQSGNPKPRMWRHIGEHSLQNAMGFNNDGLEAIVRRVSALQPFVLPIGINLGKNKTTPNEKALEDYRVGIEKAANGADYLVFNLSSPNTPNLRDLQSESFVRDLFALARTLTTKPILLKIAPDLDAANAIAIAQTAIECGASGVIATNTTNDYSLIAGSQTRGGGLSGAILAEKSRALFDALSAELYGKTVLISCGGIMDADEAWQRIKMGASLIQVFTGLIYGGAGFAATLADGIWERLNREGFTKIEDAIGSLRR